MSFKDQVIKTNYHTHMYLCRHAKGTIDDYIKKAIELNFTEIGISDHAPWEELINRSERMYPNDYKTYKLQLEEAVKNYSNQIKVKKGLEIEYFKNKDSFYKKYLNEMDYLILGQHYVEVDGELISTYRISSDKELTAYKDQVVEGMKTGYFKILAHPDLFLFSQRELRPSILKICEEIVLAAKENNVLLEINANGIRKGRINVNDEVVYRYPRKEFFEFAKKHGAKCIISSDAHKPELLLDEAIENALVFSNTLSLKVEEVLK